MIAPGVDGCLYLPFYKHPKYLARRRQSVPGLFFPSPLTKRLFGGRRQEKPSTRWGAGDRQETAKLLLREKKVISATLFRGLVPGVT